MKLGYSNTEEIRQPWVTSKCNYIFSLFVMAFNISSVKDFSDTSQRAIDEKLNNSDARPVKQITTIIFRRYFEVFA